MFREASTAGGIRIAYESEGAGTGTAIVLLHGLTEDLSQWEGVVRELRADYRTLRLDFRGHGMSAAVHEASVDDLVEDVHGVVMKEQISNPVIVGHSLGGAVASAYAALHPTAAVINVEQPMRFGALSLAARSLEGELRGDGFVDAMWKVALALGTDGLSDDKIRKLRAFREKASPSVVLSIWQPLFAWSEEKLDQWAESMLRPIRAPYLSLHGNDLGTDYCSWLRALVPTATFDIWPGAGHWPHVSDPIHFASTVRTFLTKRR